MLSIPDTATAAAVLAQPLDPELRTLIEGRLADAAAIGLAELTHLVVVERGDPLAAIQDELGWSPLVHPIDGTFYGDTAFQPYWGWIENHGSHYELVHAIGNDGFAVILLVERANGVIPALLQMCAEFCDDRR